MLSSEVLKATLTTLLFSQHTALAEQALLPTPMTVMGEQSRPKRTSTPCTTIPRRPKSAVPSAELACVVGLG